MKTILTLLLALVAFASMGQKIRKQKLAPLAFKNVISCYKYYCKDSTGQSITLSCSDSLKINGDTSKLIKLLMNEQIRTDSLLRDQIEASREILSSFNNDKYFRPKSVNWKKYKKALIHYFLTTGQKEKIKRIYK